MEIKKEMDFAVRKAEIRDIQILINHHRNMFEEIFDLENLPKDTKKMEEMDIAYKRKLDEELPEGICSSWIIKSGDKIVASASMSIISMVPNPEFTNYKMAYIHSVYTEKEFRKKGIAEIAVNEIIKHSRDSGIRRIILNASHSGKSIYEKIGFKFTDNTMSIDL